MKYEHEEKEDLAFCPECKFYYDIGSNNGYGFLCCEECAEIKIAEKEEEKTRKECDDKE